MSKWKSLWTVLIDHWKAIFNLKYDKDYRTTKFLFDLIIGVVYEKKKKLLLLKFSDLKIHGGK